MSPLTPFGLAEEYRRIRETLLAQYPELADDAEALADTLDGLTSAHDVIARLIRHSLEDMASSGALRDLEKQYSDRRERLVRRAMARKEAAFKLMSAIGERSIKRPEFSLSIAPGRAKVIVTDRTLLPEDYFRIKREPNLEAIREAIDGGEVVPGATLSNREENLTVRVA